jgi:MFS family permease
VRGFSLEERLALNTSLLQDTRFRLYLSYRLLVTLAIQMQSVAVAWQIYEQTQSPLHLGYVGLAIFIPNLLLALPGGKAADRYPRRHLMLGSIGVLLLASLHLLASTSLGSDSTPVIYTTLVMIGMARAFGNPASSAYLPQLVGPERLSQAVAVNSTIFQLGTIGGPALAGLLFSWSSGNVAYLYGLCCAFFLIALIALARLPVFPAPHLDERRQLELLGGLRFIWQQKLILGAISLDLFAVLLGGAVALLPIFARDILHVGAEGLGYMRSAPAVGAALMAAYLSFRPLRRHVGRSMLIAVALFGLFTIGFGLSRNFALSLFCLVMLGATDMISVVVRQTLIQIHTPETMRGRVSAVNMVFIGASNELGEFESGLTASWWGAVPAVVVGGIGTCFVVATWALLFPTLRRVQDFQRPSQP